ncbi:F-box protein At3g07870-like [Macadamia integrifolia]|uniref:F-box protein At3g07870-like n=1 Tax=Macadamia integrifolia TaxID=60698 RepID=UPI001C4FAA24|nr:F-box protein At3g07870-like [Macadamia integrifolia]
MGKTIERKNNPRPPPPMMGSHDHDPLFLSKEVWINVLSRLPVKTLLRFKCVCKLWRYLISDDPHFVHLHSHHHSKSKSEPCLFFVSLTPPEEWEKHREEGNPISRFEFKSKTLLPFVIPTRFDLVCIQDSDIIHICNPSTHEFITLPKPPRTSFSSCGPDGSVGFGYISSTDEYKVVRLIPPVYGLGGSRRRFTTKCLVFTLTERRGFSSYSSSSSSSPWGWRRVVDSPYQVSKYHPAFVNGAIHWLVYYCSRIDAEFYDGHMIDPRNTIVAFDVEKEEFRLIEHPRCRDLRSFKYSDFQLVELRGLLCLSCVEGSKMDIWMFKDYHYNKSGTWVKEYSIVLHPHYHYLDQRERDDHNNRHREDDYDYCAPRDIKDRKMLIETRTTGLEYHHLQTKSFEGFIDSKRMPYLRSSFFYTESLRSLKTKQSAQGNIEELTYKQTVECLKLPS